MSYSFFLFQLALGVFQLASQGGLHKVQRLHRLLQLLHVADQVGILLDQLGALVDAILHLTVQLVRLLVGAGSRLLRLFRLLLGLILHINITLRHVWVKV